MKDLLLEQYKAIRQTIKANVDTIGKLITQANGLRQIAGDVQDTALKQSLQTQITAIESTIEKLIAQTDELFDKYNEFVENLWAGK